jgi:hypothetical protein
LHFHAPFGTDKQYFGIWAQLTHGVGYGDCGENVATCATTANDYF